MTDPAGCNLMSPYFNNCLNSLSVSNLDPVGSELVRGGPELDTSNPELGPHCTRIWPRLSRISSKCYNEWDPGGNKLEQSSPKLHPVGLKLDELSYTTFQLYHNFETYNI